MMFFMAFTSEASTVALWEIFPSSHAMKLDSYQFTILFSSLQEKAGAGRVF